jgi:hypothetical protein
LRKAPWNFSKDHISAPSLQLQPWKERSPSNWVLGSRRRRSSPESGKTGGGAGLGGGENRAGALHGTIGGGFGAGGISSEGVRRGPVVLTAGRTAPTSSWPGSTRGRREKLHCVLEEGLGVAIGLESRRRHKLGKGCPAAAAGARTPASWRLGLSNKRAWMLRWCRREVGVARIGVASGRSTEFTAAASMADDGAYLCSHEEKRGKLYSWLEAVGRSLRTKAAGLGYRWWHGRVRQGMGSGVRRPPSQWRRGGAPASG